MLHIFTTSSLEKVMLKSECEAEEFASATVLRGECFSFQVAYKSDGFEEYKYEIDSEINDYIKIYDVKSVPVTVPTDPLALKDENYISHEPGLFPDLLCENNDNIIFSSSWYKSLWVIVDNSVSEGSYNIVISFKPICEQGIESNNETTTIKCRFKLRVSSVNLEPQKLIFTQWFHCDCIASYYKVPVFSEKHWELIEKFIKVACDNGINMILTPIFTPPLDTQIGLERPTVQLVDIIKHNDIYEFNFDKLKRWITICKRNGIIYFEMAHLFTQWGATCTPKIVANVNGEEKRIFGWEISADNEKYYIFLSQFIPKLKDFLKNNNVLKNTFFHISDEPSDSNVESYKKAKSISDKYLSGLNIIDALSDYKFYENKLVENPVVSIHNIKQFLDKNVENLWAYYCCCEHTGVSNRFIAMPSYRNRYIACQLFKYNIRGFLQWGYNFYYSYLSRHLIDPFTDTSAGGRFPCGDSFSVYPAADGPKMSLRLVVFNEALQDLRAMQMLEKHMGHKRVVEIIEGVLGINVCFEKCADNSQIILKLRSTINHLIEYYSLKSNN